MNQFITVFFLAIVGLNPSLWSQTTNLVPNPSFENITNCPVANSQFHNATPWQKPLQSITTPDLFGTCFTTSGSNCNSVGVPANFGGSSAARTGNNYMGLITKYGNNLREYLTVQLSAPLIAGETYDVGAYIKLAPSSRYANNHFGIDVSSTQPSQTTGCCNNGVININPEIEGSNVVSDRTNWTLISGTYTANGGERFITLGNFKPDAQNTIQDFGNMGGACALVTAGAYYYVEDVFLRISAPLAIEGLDLVAEENSDRTVDLYWSSAAQAEYVGFSLERSGDGVSFSSLGADLPPSSGYLLDESPLSGESFYRMRAVDLAGEVHYSEVQTVSFSEENTFSVQAFPNPFQDAFSIHIDADNAEEVFTVTLSDCFGRLVLSKEIQAVGGNAKVELNALNTLASGVYILNISNGQEQIIKKLNRM